MPDTVYRKDSIFIGAGKYDTFANVIAHKLLARWWHRPYFDSIARAFVNNAEDTLGCIERKDDTLRGTPPPPSCCLEGAAPAPPRKKKKKKRGGGGAPSAAPPPPPRGGGGSPHGIILT